VPDNCGQHGTCLCRRAPCEPNYGKGSTSRRGVMRLGKKAPPHWGGLEGDGGAEIHWQQLVLFFCRHDHNSNLRNWLRQFSAREAKSRRANPTAPWAKGAAVNKSRRGVARPLATGLRFPARPPPRHAVGAARIANVGFFWRKAAVRAQGRLGQLSARSRHKRAQRHGYASPNGPTIAAWREEPPTCRTSKS